jgi:hypothetical protein
MIRDRLHELGINDVELGKIDFGNRHVFSLDSVSDHSSVQECHAEQREASRTEISHNRKILRLALRMTTV